jgi:hypothetical protein
VGLRRGQARGCLSGLIAARGRSLASGAGQQIVLELEPPANVLESVLKLEPVHHPAVEARNGCPHGNLTCLPPHELRRQQSSPPFREASPPWRTSSIWIKERRRSSPSLGVPGPDGRVVSGRDTARVQRAARQRPRGGRGEWGGRQGTGAAHPRRRQFGSAGLAEVGTAAVSSTPPPAA